MRIQNNFRIPVFENAVDGLNGEENLNAGQPKQNLNNNPIANGQGEPGDPKKQPEATNRPDHSREDLDRTADAFGKGMGALLGKNPAGDSDNPVGKTVGAVVAGPGLAEKAVLGFYAWFVGAVSLGIFDAFRVLGGSKREQSYVEEYTRGMLGIVGIDANKKKETMEPLRIRYVNPLGYDLSFLPENDPLRAEYQKAQELLKTYDRNEDSERGAERHEGAQQAVYAIEEKIREKSKGVQKEINELPHSIRSAESSDSIRKDYQERLARLNHLVENERRPHKLDDWLKALERLEGEYSTLQRWLELKDIYDKQPRKGARSNGVTYDLPANDKVSGLLAEPASQQQFVLSSNNLSPFSRPIPMTYDLPVNGKISGLIAEPKPQKQTAMTSANSNVVIQTAQDQPDKQNPLFGIRPIPMTYDLPVSGKISGLIAEPKPQKQTAMTSANSNVVIQTAQDQPDKQNPLFGIRPIPMTYDLPVSGKISGLIAEPKPQKQTAMTPANSNVVIQTAQNQPDKQNPLFGIRPIPMTYDLPVSGKISGLIAEPKPQKQVSSTDEKAKAQLLQIQLKARGLLA